MAHPVSLFAFPEKNKLYFCHLSSESPKLSGTDVAATLLTMISIVPLEIFVGIDRA
jgi:hypothetical protein